MCDEKMRSQYWVQQNQAKIRSQIVLSLSPSLSVTPHSPPNHGGASVQPYFAWNRHNYSYLVLWKENNISKPVPIPTAIPKSPQFPSFNALEAQFQRPNQRQRHSWLQRTQTRAPAACQVGPRGGENNQFPQCPTRFGYNDLRESTPAACCTGGDVCSSEKEGDIDGLGTHLDAQHVPRGVDSTSKTMQKRPSWQRSRWRWRRIGRDSERKETRRCASGGQKLRR